MVSIRSLQKINSKYKCTENQFNNYKCKHSDRHFDGWTDRQSDIVDYRAAYFAAKNASSSVGQGNLLELSSPLQNSTARILYQGKINEQNYPIAKNR